MFVNEMSNLYRGPSLDLPTKFRFIWLCGFRGEDFLRNQPIGNKKIACGGHAC